MMLLRTVAFVLSLTFCGVAQAAEPDAGNPMQTAPLIEQAIKIPLVVPGPSGERRFLLDALVVRPRTEASLPLAIITHGTPRLAEDRRKLQIGWFAMMARDFARRGYVAVVVMRRGHGASEGDYAEGVDCSAPDYVRAGRTAAEDLTGAIRQLSTLPYVDGSRVLGIGVSTGGFSWLAVSAQAPASLKAVINFAGGHGSYKLRANCGEERMLTAMQAFGATSRIPTIWVYSENDSYLVPDLVRRMHAAFTQAGGNAALKMLPPFEADGHDLSMRATGAHLWTPPVDAFLAGHGLPTWSAAAAHEVPLPTLAGREHFEKYLTAPAEKAFALSLDGSFDWWWSGLGTIEDAKRRALEGCEQAGIRSCRVFAVNFGLVRQQ